MDFLRRHGNITKSQEREREKKIANSCKGQLVAVGDGGFRGAARSYGELGKETRSTDLREEEQRLGKVL